MPAFGKDQLKASGEASGYSQNSGELGGMMVTFEHIPRGDYSDKFKDLPEGRCQSPHWGYAFKGKVLIHYADHDETIEGGQAYYIAPGHTPEVLEDADVVEFSSPEEFHQTVERGFLSTK